jgi:thiamine kinase-like enzyme
MLLDLHKAGDIPERVVHNDAKISNALFDRETGEALCIVDLDTVMPGLALYDFGDMVRSMTCPASEDETDLSRVDVQIPLFEALARGYLETAAPFLTTAERANLVTAGKLITLEQGVRFLTDFLNGDTYYRTQRSNQNLDRCRTQFKLVESIIQHERQMVRFVESL